MSRLHKQATHLITTLHAAGVGTLVIGDVRDLRQTTDVGHMNNQKIHQWSAGSVLFTHCRLHKKMVSYEKGMKLPFGKIRIADDG